MGDTQLIAIECQAAQDEDREISDACARVIASQWHSDDISAAFSTTGAISDPTDVYRSLFYLRGQSVYPSMTAADKLASDMLGTYLTNAGVRGPVPGWSGLWLRIASEHSEPQHADYPHEPGYLIGCPACEGKCHCDGQSAECVFGGEHNGAGNGGSCPGSACQDCLVYLANGDLPGDWTEDQVAEYHANVAKHSGDYRITLGTLDHSCRDDDGRMADECDCEQLGFSWSACDVCGSNLGGNRYAVTFWPTSV